MGMNEASESSGMLLDAKPHPEGRTRELESTVCKYSCKGCTNSCEWERRPLRHAIAMALMVILLDDGYHCAFLKAGCCMSLHWERRWTSAVVFMRCFSKSLVHLFSSDSDSFVFL